jgi:hypothetical protein
MQIYQKKILTYLKAKDENKPNLMNGIFDSNAKLIMNVQSQNIDFPAEVDGIDEITKVLVQDFALQYEDVYSFCFSNTASYDKNQVKVAWLVCMRDKQNKQLKFGKGYYVWQFNNDSFMVEKLTIDIEQMHILPKEYGDEIFLWLNDFDGKWVNEVNFLNNKTYLSTFNIKN